MGVIQRHRRVPVWGLLLLGALLCVHAPAAPGDGNPYNFQSWVVNCLETFKGLAVDTLIKNYSGKTVRSRKDRRDPGAPDFEVKVHDRLGFGVTAGAYEAEVTGIPGLEAFADANGRVAVKWPHRMRGLGVMPLGSGPVVGEIELYNALKGRLATIERSAEFPRDPAWNRGGLPTLEVSGPYLTEAGPMLVKPLLRGMTLRDIWNKYQPSAIEDLPKEMRQSLREFFGLAQAAYQMGTVEAGPEGPAPPGGRFLLDINPTNLVWVSDPADLARFGLKRPSFMAYEFGQTQDAVFRQVGTPESYESIFLGFVQAKGR